MNDTGSTTHENFENQSDEHRRLLRQEELILDVTEALSRAMESHRITKTALAKRLGKSTQFVSQLLAGGEQLTLRTLADVADAIGHRARIVLD